MHILEQMEDWQIDFEWLRIRHFLKKRFNKSELPDLNATLFLMGIRIHGRWKNTYTKEEKQDLMHISICELLSDEGYYEFEGRDQDGWPHYKALKSVEEKGVQNQELYLKKKIIKYFKSEQLLNDEEE